MPGDADNKGGDTGSAGETAQQLSQLQGQLKDLQSSFESMKQAKEQLEKQYDDASKELLSPSYLEFLEGKKGGGGKKSEGEGAKELNFDEMSPNQMVKHLVTAYKGDLDKSIKVIDDKISDLETRLQSAFGQIDVTITAQKHSDFGEALELPPTARNPEQKLLIDTVHQVATENPTWNAERCYKHAKLVIKQEADEKLAAESARAEKDRKALTEKGGAPIVTMQEKAMGKDEAAQTAWKATFGNKDKVD